MRSNMLHPSPPLIAQEVKAQAIGFSIDLVYKRIPKGDELGSSIS